MLCLPAAVCGAADWAAKVWSREEVIQSLKLQKYDNFLKLGTPTAIFLFI